MQAIDDAPGACKANRFAVTAARRPVTTGTDCLSPLNQGDSWLDSYDFTVAGAGLSNNVS
jgi:hypothetical protein